jgi:hypothetical protein
MMTTFALVIAAWFAIIPVRADTGALTPQETSFRERNSEDSDEHFLTGRPHVGALGGFSTLPDGKTGGVMGVDVGFQPYSPLSAGINFAVAGPLQDSRRMTLMAKGAYNFGGTLPIIRYSYAGINLGWIHDSSPSFADLARTHDYFAFGPTIGFDQPFHRLWTIGAEGKIHSSFESDTPSSLVILGTLKYWL